MRTGWLLPLSFLLAALPGLAGASTIQVSWTGAVDFVQPQVASVFTLGDPASGSFQIDTATADVNPDPSIGEYPGAVTAVLFRFGSFEASGSSGSLIINNTIGDGFSVRMGGSGASVGGFPVESVWFHVEGGPGSLPSDAIPLSLELAQFREGGGIVFAAGSSLLLGASASSLSYVVPEPGTGALLGLGMLMLLPLRRRR